MNVPELMSTAEASRITGRDPRTIRRWIADEAVPDLGVEIGGKLYIRRQVLDRLLRAPSADVPLPAA